MDLSHVSIPEMKNLAIFGVCLGLLACIGAAAGWAKGRSGRADLDELIAGRVSRRLAEVNGICRTSDQRPSYLDVLEPTPSIAKAVSWYTASAAVAVVPAFTLLLFQTPCIVLGLPALVYTLSARRRVSRGELGAAREALATSRAYAVFALCLGVLPYAAAVVVLLGFPQVVERALQ